MEKKFKELEVRSQKLHEEYEAVRMEKNGLIELIQTTKERNAKAQQQLTAFSDEQSQLKKNCELKADELHHKRQELTRATSERDTLRAEANRLLTQYRIKREEVEISASTMELLHKKIESHESHLTRLKLDYQSVLEQRNKLALVLVERNDELCLLYERLNVQTNILGRAEAEMRDREEDKMRLNLEAQNIRRDISRLEKIKPTVKRYREEIEVLQKQFLRLEQIENELGNQIEIPRLDEIEASTQQKARNYRQLKGSDPVPETLRQKLKKTSQRLTEKDREIETRQLAIKDLDSRENDARRQIDENQKANALRHEELRTAIRNAAALERQIMSTVSELSMYQAQAMKLEDERNMTEEEVSKAREQMDQGKAPNEAIDEEWQRLYRHVERRREEKQRSLLDWKMLCDQLGIDFAWSSNMADRVERDGQGIFFRLQAGKRTAAIPRPSAYYARGERNYHLIQPLDLANVTDSVLQTHLPQPYGKFAPFKPIPPPKVKRTRANTTSLALTEKPSSLLPQIDIK